MRYEGKILRVNKRTLAKRLDWIRTVEEVARSSRKRAKPVFGGRREDFQHFDNGHVRTQHAKFSPRSVTEISGPNGSGKSSILKALAKISRAAQTHR